MSVYAKNKLLGSASWPALLGSALFWVWLDRGMFGTSLFPSTGQDMIETVTIVVLLASTLTFFVVAVSVVRGGKEKLWQTKFLCLAAGFGVVGALLCVLFGKPETFILFYLGGIFLGCSMGAFNVIWGVIAVAQGTERAVLHIAGAWGLGLFLNIALFLLPPIFDCFTVMVLPLLSFVCYSTLKRLQARGRYHIDPKGDQEKQREELKLSANVDPFFLVTILIFCSAFGFVSWFGEGLSLASNGSEAEYLTFARGLVALIFFAACYLFSTKYIELLLRIALSLVAAGVVILTIGVFISEMNGFGRILVAMGYSGFDILVWTLIAFYARSSTRRAFHVIAIVMAAEQLGILFGFVSGIIIDAVAAEQVTSIFLAAMNYILFLAYFALMRRYNRQPILSANVSSSPNGASSAINQFSEQARLTLRETQIASLLAEGRNVPYIAQKFFVSENTIKSHVRHIYEKSGIHNRQELLDKLEDIRGF